MKAKKTKRAKRTKLGLELEDAFAEMVAHLRGELKVPGHEVPDIVFTPERIKAIRRKVATSTKEFERLFGIPARTMESYEQGRRRLDGAMQALLRIIEREPKAARRALAA
jgi:putative transcriptional regulator